MFDWVRIRPVARPHLSCPAIFTLCYPPLWSAQVSIPPPPLDRWVSYLMYVSLKSNQAQLLSFSMEVISLSRLTQAKYSKIRFDVLADVAIFEICKFKLGYISITLKIPSFKIPKSSNYKHLQITLAFSNLSSSLSSSIECISTLAEPSLGLCSIIPFPSTFFSAHFWVSLWGPCLLWATGGIGWGEVSGWHLPLSHPVKYPSSILNNRLSLPWDPCIPHRYHYSDPSFHVFKLHHLLRRSGFSPSPWFLLFPIHQLSHSLYP